MAFTDIVKYSTPINIWVSQAEATALATTYRPELEDVTLDGTSMIIRLLTATTPETVNDTIATDQKATTTITLTAVPSRSGLAWNQPQISDNTSPKTKMAYMMNLGSGHIRKALDALYAAVSNTTGGGTAINAGTTPTGATLVTAIDDAISRIAARDGGYEASIVFDTTSFGLFRNTVGAAFQPFSNIINPGQKGGPFQGWYLGYNVFVTATTMTDSATTPVGCAALVYDKMGVAYVPMPLDIKYFEFDSTAKERLISRNTYSVGVISNLKAYRIMKSVVT